MEVDHSGFQLGMAHISLDNPQIDSGFKKMGGIGVPQGMNGDSFFMDSSSNLGTAEGALDTTFGHGKLSVLCPCSTSAKGGEEEAGMVVGPPIAAEQKEGRLREGHIAILGSLSTVDMDHQAVGVDIGDFEMETFVKSEAAGIDGGKIGVILEGLDLGQDTSDFLDAENGWESSFGLGSEDSEDMPVLLNDVLEKEANPAIADAHGIGGPVIPVLSVEEIVLEFLLGDQIGGFVVELTQHANGACIGLLSSFSFAIELKSLDRSVIPLCLHDTSPFFIMRDFPCHGAGVWRYHTRQSGMATIEADF